MAVDKGTLRPETHPASAAAAPAASPWKYIVTLGKCHPSVTVEFFLNVFSEFSEFSDKNICLQ